MQMFELIQLAPEEMSDEAHHRLVYDSIRNPGRAAHTHTAGEMYPGGGGPYFTRIGMD